MLISKYLLTSNGFNTEAIKTVFLENMDKAPSESRVSIITTASPLKEENKYAQKAKEDLKDMGFKFVHYVDLEFDDPEVLLNSDVVYINGGNPFHLLFHIKKSGAEKIFQRLSQEETIFVGVSAGSLILGPNIKVVQFFTPNMNTLQLEDLAGLNLIHTIIFPHYDREDIFKDHTGKSIEERLIKFEKLHNCLVHRIKDDQYILLEH